MPLDDEGFLDSQVPIRTSLVEACPGDLLSLRAASEAPALVVLGEPGIGKSTALRAIAEHVRTRGAEVVWLDGADLAEETFADELGAHVGGRLATGAVAGAARDGLTVVIDALDESAIVRRFPRRLREALARRDLASLRLVLGCRTADVPVDLADTLEQSFGMGMVFADLAPLRRSDAVLLASSLDAPGEELISAAVRIGAGSLASIPLTLGLLVQEFLENGILGLSARELFERGVTTLLDTSRSGFSTRDSSTVDQRRAVAERVAAAMLLSGKRTVFVGRELDVGKQDLRAGEVSDGFERTASGQFAVTPSVVNATLATALFGGRGTDRFAFVHASQAAFLAAWYLRRHEPRVPRRQLEGLLLVAAPDGSKTVPVPLRELAAWLACLDPTAGAWLAETDPESMVGHESYLDSDELRAAVVRALLLRAEEFELGERSWSKGIDLSHPGLAAQVLVVLNEFDAQPAEWKDFARCRVALRLARHASSPELTERLIRIAESTGWNAHLGSLAVEAALAHGANSIPKLNRLLRELADPVFARRRDPDDELRGYLLDGLWPEHIGIAEVLSALKPRQSQLFGMYWAFLRRFPEQLDDAHLAAALQWAVEGASRDAATAVESVDEEPLPDDRPIGAIDAMLAEGLVERALASARALEFIAYAAALAWPRLDRYDQPTLPSSLDEVQAGRPTTPQRRAFAEALLRHKAGLSAHPRIDIWRMVREWRTPRLPLSDNELAGRSSLLDPADFAWAVERAKELEEMQPPLAGAMAELAGLLFSPYNVEAVELASRQRGTIVWEHLARWFDAVELHSELANRLREQHSWTTENEQPHAEIGEAAGAFREDLLQQYARVVDGDWTQFWRLAGSLQFDPDTARGRRQLGDRLLSFPAVSVLPADAPAQLVAPARAFLLHEHDHADEWLGTDKYDRRAWAGYLALALLDEANQLESVPIERMKAWTGAILWMWSVPSQTADPARKSRLLGRAIGADPPRMAELLPRYVRGELRRGASVSELEAFDLAAVQAIQAAWTEIIVELYAALLPLDAAVSSVADPSHPLTGFSSDEERSRGRSAWQQLFRGLALADPPAAEVLATSWAAMDGDAGVKSLAATAIVVLLSTDGAAWRRLVATVQADQVLGREVAAAIVGGHYDVALLAELDERELGDLYVWLATVYPPERDEPEHLGVSWVTPAAQARHFRDGVLTAIANRATEDAVLVLSSLREQFPSRIIVLSNLVRARLGVFASAWEPPSAAEVQSLLENARRRLVRSGEELALLIHEALQAVEVEFCRTGQLLWDRLPKVDGAPRPWVPKPEAALSTFLAHDLQLRLHDRGVAVNREVLVKQTDPYGAGDRPDILVEATTRVENASIPVVHRVAIEVKGSWNRDVLTAQRDQLALRYLPEAQTGVGLYVVGWYPKELWDPADYRRGRVAKATREELFAELSAQASEIRSTTAVVVTPVVLAVPRPAPNGPADTE